MQIIVDADACPKAVKEILYRASNRLNVSLLIVANQYLRTPPFPQIRNIVVQEGADEADDKIVELTNPGDLVITADIPLADRVIKRGGFALDPRGILFTEENIKQRLSVRDLMDELRNCGMQTGGPCAHSKKDTQEFVNQFDSFMNKRLRKT